MSSSAVKTGDVAPLYNAFEEPARNTGGHDGRVQVAGVLETVGRELRELAVRVDGMHILVANGASRLASDPACIEAAQGIDVVSQHLAAIADFLGVLGLNLPEDWMVDPAPAAKVVTLSALAAKLGCPDAARNLAGSPAAAEWELF